MKKKESIDFEDRASFDMEELKLNNEEKNIPGINDNKRVNNLMLMTPTSQQRFADIALSGLKPSEEVVISENDIYRKRFNRSQLHLINDSTEKPVEVSQEQLLNNLGPTVLEKRTDNNMTNLFFHGAAPNYKESEGEEEGKQENANQIISQSYNNSAKSYGNGVQVDAQMIGFKHSKTFLPKPRPTGD